MNLKKTVTGLILLLFSMGKSLAQDAVPAAGGNGTGTGGSMSYTVGQVVYTANTGSNGSVSQGVQHAYDIVNTIEETENISLVMAYPNPVADALTLRVDEDDLTGFSYELYNNQGQLVNTNLILNNQTLVAMNELSTSTYFLKVKKNDQVVQSFTIVKK